MPSTYGHLLAPGRIGTLQLRNRIIMSPMGSNLAEEDGYCGERIEYQGAGDTRDAHGPCIQTLDAKGGK